MWGVGFPQKKCREWERGDHQRACRTGEVGGRLPGEAVVGLQQAGWHTQEAYG
jgi:hypothetical protein